MNHATELIRQGDQQAPIQHNEDATTYYTTIHCNSAASIYGPKPGTHLYVLKPEDSNNLSFAVSYYDKKVRKWLHSTMWPANNCKLTQIWLKFGQLLPHSGTTTGKMALSSISWVPIIQAQSSFNVELYSLNILWQSAKQDLIRLRDLD